MKSYTPNWWILFGSSVIISLGNRNYGYSIREAVIDGENDEYTLITRTGSHEPVRVPNSSRIDFDTDGLIIPWSLHAAEGQDVDLDEIYDCLEAKQIWEQNRPIYFAGSYRNSDEGILRSPLITKLIPIGGEFIAVTENGNYLLRGKPMRKEARQ